MGEGELVLVPMRSGGAFDPLGARPEDVRNGIRVRELVNATPGRWLFVTLTVGRSAFLGPEFAYAVCNERVREVGQAIAAEGLWMGVLELQGKTGQGWPHWHLLVYGEGDPRTDDELREAVRRMWRTRHERVDEETGEVVSELVPIAGPRGVDVQTAVSREGVAVYVAKYVQKAWDAVPAWMGESRRQLRKFRASPAVYRAWESMGLHTRKLGARRQATHRRRPARKLFDRMAHSGLTHALFTRRGGSLKFVRPLGLPACETGADLLLKLGAEPIRLGAFGRMRWRVPDRAVWFLAEQGPMLRAMRAAEYRRRREDLAARWDEVQRVRAEAEAVQTAGECG